MCENLAVGSWHFYSLEKNDVSCCACFVSTLRCAVDGSTRVNKSMRALPSGVLRGLLLALLRAQAVGGNVRVRAL
jgi:hypothetical protein